MPEDAEAALLKSLEVARGQQAKSWELRAAMTLARLWAGHGRRRDGLALLKPVYEWFAEGHDTRDLMMAAQLVDELGHSERPVQAMLSSRA